MGTKPWRRNRPSVCWHNPSSPLRSATSTSLGQQTSLYWLILCLACWTWKQKNLQIQDTAPSLNSSVTWDKLHKGSKCQLPKSGLPMTNVSHLTRRGSYQVPHEVCYLSWSSQQPCEIESTVITLISCLSEERMGFERGWGVCPWTCSWKVAMLGPGLG